MHYSTPLSTSVWHMGLLCCSHETACNTTCTLPLARHTQHSLCGFSLSCTAPPTAPQFTCTLPGEGILRLNWNDTGDAVTEYRVCDCTSPGCSCVPMRCGTTSVCDTNLAAGQEQTFSFTALNCGNSQESSVSTLTTAGADGRLTDTN